MSLNNMDWKAWVALLICVVILCGIGTSLSAHAETEAPTDMAAVSEKESERLDDSADSTDVPASAEDGQPEDAIEEPLTESPDNPAAAEPDAPVETPDPSPEPELPTDQPVTEPTITPDVPTNTPDVPTEAPTEAPTKPPTEQPTETPTEQPTIPPVDPKTLFDVDIKVPSGWRNTSSAMVRIKITPATEQMWHQVRYRLGSEDWHPIKNSDLILYEGYYYTDIEVYGNAKLTVRLFGDEDTYFDTNKEIRVFDHAAPAVTAGFRDMLLHVEAVDELSGVAGIQVNGLLFTTLVEGNLDVRMEGPLLGYRQLAVRAYDYAGNFSDPVTLDNPYYVEPTPEPTFTPKPATKPTTKPTKKPSGSSGSKKPTAAPEVTATPAPTAAPTQQIVYVTPNPGAYPYLQPAATAEPETVYVPLGPGQPYKQEGNMQTLDMLYSASTNKQFITVKTRAGETYYMVIDYDKPIDEENEIYETYFLNLVDDRDLMSVVSEEEIVATPTPQIVYVTPEPTEVPQQAPPIVVEDDNSGMLSMLLLVIGIAAVGGAVFWVVRQKKNNAAQQAPDFEDEYNFEEDENEEE